MCVGGPRSGFSSNVSKEEKERNKKEKKKKKKNSEKTSNKLNAAAYEGNPTQCRDIHFPMSRQAW